MSDLKKQLTSLIEGAELFKAEHGSCEVIVNTTSPIGLARIERVAGFRIAADELHFCDVMTGEKTTLKDSEVYFHTEDDPTFGSKFEGEDDDGWWLS